MKNATRRIVPMWTYCAVVLLGLGVGIWSVRSNTGGGDMVYAILYPNLSVLVPQPLLLMIILRQVLTYRAIGPLISIRGQAEMVQRRLLMLVVTEVSLYFGAFYGAFVVSGARLFADGTPLIGGLLLMLRYCLILLLGIVLVWGYRRRQPGILLILTVVISASYHYWLEATYLLSLYSPIYNPLYRAIHHIYLG